MKQFTSLNLHRKGMIHALVIVMLLAGMMLILSAHTFAAASPEAIQDSTLIQPGEPDVKMLEKALLVERYGKEYGL